MSGLIILLEPVGLWLQHQVAEEVESRQGDDGVELAGPRSPCDSDRGRCVCLQCTLDAKICVCVSVCMFVST